jgi:hypothetical protein
MGKVFGKWVVVSFAGYRQRKDGLARAYWVVACICGFRTEVAATSLISNYNVSCVGCRKTRAYEDKTYAAFNALWVSYRSGAKRRNLSWNLSKDQFRYIIEQPCRYCEIVRNGVHRHSNGNEYKFTGIDRVDNKLGYFLGNVVPCCGKCNRFKRAATFKQIEAFYIVMKEFRDARAKI